MTLTWAAVQGANAYIIHYGKDATTDPTKAKYMEYSEGLTYTLKAADIPVEATSGDKVTFYIQAYHEKAPATITDPALKAKYLHDGQFTGSAWSAAKELTVK